MRVRARARAPARPRQKPIDVATFVQLILSPLHRYDHSPEEIRRPLLITFFRDTVSFPLHSPRFRAISLPRAYRLRDLEEQWRTEFVGSDYWITSDK